MRRSGFTTVELAIVVVIIGIIALMGFPKIRNALAKNNVRSARAAVTVLAATARAAAVQRGCPAVLHFSSAADGTVWVTACPRLAAGAGTVDTVSAVEVLSTRFSVTCAATRDSVRYDPRGLSTDNAATTVRIRGTTTASQDSVMINNIGKVVR